MAKRTRQQIAEARAKLPKVTRELGGHVTAGGKGMVPCPCHEDIEPSVSINPGDDHEFVWHDQSDAHCDPYKIRETWIMRGTPPELLGGYLAPSTLARKPAASADHRAESDRWRTAFAVEHAKVAAMVAVLADDSITTPTLLRARIMLAAEGGMPATRKEFKDLCLRAGCKETQLKPLLNLYYPTSG